MNTQKKLFAFKLADKQAKSADQNKWKARDGVALAACTSFSGPPKFATFTGADTDLLC